LGRDGNRPDYSAVEHGGFASGYVTSENLTDNRAGYVDVVPFSVPAGNFFYVQVVTGMATFEDGDLLSEDTFDYPPSKGYFVYLNINGRYTVPADGGPDVPASPLYFTDSTGTVTREGGDMQVGDLMHWNGSVEGYEIDPTDYLLLSYYTTTKPS